LVHIFAPFKFLSRAADRRPAWRPGYFPPALFCRKGRVAALSTTNGAKQKLKNCAAGRGPYGLGGGPGFDQRRKDF